MKSRIGIGENLPRKPNPPPDDKNQSSRFIETAKELGVLDSPAEVERAMAILRPILPPKAKKSDKSNG